MPQYAKTRQMLVTVPAALQEALQEEASRRDRTLVNLNRMILSAWAQKNLGYEAEPVIDHRTTNSGRRKAPTKKHGKRTRRK